MFNGIAMLWVRLLSIIGDAKRMGFKLIPIHTLVLGLACSRWSLGQSTRVKSIHPGGQPQQAGLSINALVVGFLIAAHGTGHTQHNR